MKTIIRRGVVACAWLFMFCLSPTLLYAAGNNASVGSGTNTTVVVDSLAAGGPSAVPGLPSGLGPLDYVPASPSDELREEVGHPAPTLEEVPTQPNMTIPNDNAA